MKSSESSGINKKKVSVDNTTDKMFCLKKIFSEILSFSISAIAIFLLFIYYLTYYLDFPVFIQYLYIMSII